MTTARRAALAAIPLALTQCAPTCTPPPPAPVCLDPATMHHHDEHTGEDGNPIHVWYVNGPNGPRPAGHSTTTTGCIEPYDDTTRTDTP